LPDTTESNALRSFSPSPKPNETAGLTYLTIIAWKFIIRHFYQNSETPLAFTDHRALAKLTLGRFAELALGYCRKIKLGSILTAAAENLLPTPKNAHVTCSHSLHSPPPETCNTHPAPSLSSENTNSNNTFPRLATTHPTELFSKR
jgi:hypothetical protein